VATLEQRGDDLLLRVRVQPKASRVQLLVESGAVKVTVTAPPADGLANKMVCETVADKAGLAKSRVKIHSGDKSRDKVLLISDLDIEAARERLGL
jgi:uncharacterized protein (TIGR00251 family)